MAISEITSQRNTSGTAGSASITVTYPATPANGDLLVAAMSWRGDTTISAVPTGWSLAKAGGNGAGIDSAIYYKVAGAGEATVHTWTLAVSNKSAVVASEWSGLAATPLDASNANTATGTAGTTGATGVLAQANELIVALYSNINVSTWGTYDNGQAEVGQVASTGAGVATRNNTAMATKIVAATTSVNYGATLSASQIWSSAVATFKASNVITQALTGGLTFAGALTKLDIKPLAGVLSFVGTAAKQTGKGLTGVLSFAGIVSKQTAKALTGVLSFIGALTGVKLVLKTVAGALSFGGGLAKQAAKPLAGVLSFASGAVSRAVLKALAGALSFAGAASRLPQKALSGILSFAGTITTASVFGRSVAGALSFGGSLLDNAKTIAGITKDSVGTALASCIVKLFRTATDAKVAEKTSDAGGNYSIKVASAAAHYAVAYKAGAPDVAGTTKNDVTGT